MHRVLAFAAAFASLVVRLRADDCAAVSTLAGSGVMSSTDGAAFDAAFNQPYSVAVSPNGATVYVVDPPSHKIRSVSAGVVSVFAGCATFACANGFTDGAAIGASFNYPYSVAVSPSGATVYISDTGNNKIRSVSAGVVSVLAGCATGACTAGSTDGAAIGASFSLPYGIAVSPSGATVYVADSGNQKIRSVSAGVVSVFAGSGLFSSTDGVAIGASFSQPTSVTVSPSGATVYIADSGNNKIRAVSAGIVTVLSGYAIGAFAGGSTDGAGTSAQFNSPTGVAVSPNGTVLVADQFNNKIRSIALKCLDAGVTCSSNASCTSGSCRGGACCNTASVGFGCSACAYLSGTCQTRSPGEACAVSADCASNLCLVSILWCASPPFTKC